MQQSPSEAILKTLLESDVLERTPDGISLTAAFRSQYETHKVPEESLPSHADEGGPQTQARRVEGYEQALREMNVPLSDTELEAAAESLTTIATEDGEIVTVEGAALPGFLDTHDQVVVLITKADCPPCETVRSKLETLVTEGVVPEDVVLAEVPGADAQRLLWEEYDVVGAPTLLLCRHGRVEIRLTGDSHLEQLRSDMKRVYA